MTPWYEGHDIPGLFVLGTAAHSRDYRSSAGGFVHGFRYTGESPIDICYFVIFQAFQAFFLKLHNVVDSTKMCHNWNHLDN